MHILMNKNLFSFSQVLLSKFSN